MILNVENLSHGFGDRAIFNNVSFRLLKGEHIGLIGANGEGKSTFMNIVTGKLMPDEGKVEWAKNIRVGYLDQHTVLEPGMTIGDVLRSAFSYLYEMEERMTAIFEAMADADAEQMEAMMEESGTIQDLLTNHDFYVIDAKVDEIARAFGLAEIGLDRDVTELSGGQRTKVLLAKLLLEKPDILLLDEPTNHLDLPSIAWLESYIINYSGSVLIVAHDRYFLERTVTKIIELDNGICTVYSGRYSDYSAKRSMIRAAKLKAYYNNQREIKHQQEVIDKLKSFNREKSIKRAESREKMLSKMDVIEKPSEDSKGMHFELEPAIVSGNDVLTVTDLTKSFGSRTLFSGINFEIKRGERVALIGANGTGKTTILKIINGLCDADSGTVRLGSNVECGYYDQEHHVLDMNKTLFQEISDAYPDMTNTRIRNVLAAFLFTDDDVFKRIGDLSGGERGRVLLAKLMLSNSNFLLLDEPTNHLDINSKEILEDALNHYTGTCFFVSHDRYFINSVATRILDLRDHTITGYIGNYDYYLEKSSGNAAVPVKQGSNVTSSSSKEDRLLKKEQQAKERKRLNEIAAIEKRISEIDSLVVEIDNELAKEEVYTDHTKASDFSRKRDELLSEQEKLYSDWENLEENS